MMTAPQIDFTAPRLNLRVERGQPWALGASIPLNLTGCTFVCQIRPAEAGASPASPTASPTATLVSSGATSVVRVSQTKAQTLAIVDPAEYRWELITVNAGDPVLNGLPLLKGMFRLDDRIAVAS